MISKFSRAILGMDIRSDAVWAVLVRSGRKGMTIEKTAHASFTSTGDDENGLSGALTEIVSRMNIAGAYCIVALPFTRLSLRTLEVPFKEPKKIRQILPFELEPALTLPVDAQIIDFIPIKNTTPANETELLIAVVEQNELKDNLDRLKEAGIDPEVITMNGHATAMAMAHLKKQEDFICADIGIKKIVVYAVSQGQVRFIRSFPAPLDPAKKTALMVNHMRHTLLAYEEQFPRTPPPENLYLTGKGADDGNLRHVLEEELHVTAHPLDLLTETGIAPCNEDDGAWHAHGMNNALALCFCDTMGLKGFNFQKGEFAGKKVWTDHRKEFIGTGILAGLVLVLFLFGGLIQTYLLNRRIEDVRSQITGVFQATFPDKKVTHAPLDQIRAEIRAGKNTTLFVEDTGTHVRAIDMLNEISRSIPPEIDGKFTKLVFGGGTVLVTGNTDTFNAVDDMKNRLEISDMFKAVTISSATMDRSGKRVEFKLKIDLS